MSDTKIERVSREITLDAPVLPPALLKKGKLGPLRVEILECSGGEGHKSSADAVQKALESHFQGQGIKIKCKRRDVGSHLFPDFLGKMTGYRYKVLDVHNFLAKHGYHKVIKGMVKIGKWVHKWHFPRNVLSFNRHYDRKAEKGSAPDLVISAVPFVNGPLLTSLKERDIPLMVVTTDADNALFSHNWPAQKTEGEFAPYRYCIPYNTYEIAQKVNAAVDPEKIRGIGYPVRPEFRVEYTAEDVQKFRKELNIDRKNVVGVMMGGLGGTVTEKYIGEILTSVKKGTLENNDTHFNVFCGRNEQMVATIRKMARKAGFKEIEGHQGEGFKYIHPKTGVTLTALGFTKNVHKYMAMSRLWVTKSGSGSFFESLYMGVPMLFDNVNDPLYWENLNIEMGDTYRFGNSVKKFPEFIGQLNTMLKDETYAKFHQSIQEYKAERPLQQHFDKSVVRLTYELLQEVETHKEKKIQREQEAKAAALLRAQQPKPTLLQRLRKVGSAMLRSAKKIYDLAVSFLLFPIKLLTHKVIDYGFFSGFGMKESLRKKRRKDLIQGIRRDRNGPVREVPHKATPVEGLDRPLFSPVSKKPIDALRIKSGSAKRTGNAVLFVLGKDYQGLHPKNYDHLLEDGADVILFNPSAYSAKAMAADMKEVIRNLQEQNPKMKLAVHGYCIGAHVAASVVSEIAAGKASGIPQQSLPAIIDRGYGDGLVAAQHICFLARFPFAKRYINRYYNNQTHENIEKHDKAMLFLTPETGNDQLLHIRKKNKVLNQTEELWKRHGKHVAQEKNRIIRMPYADHWTPWTIDVHNQVKEFLSGLGVVSPEYKKLDKDYNEGFKEVNKVPFFRRKVLPLIL